MDGVGVLPPESDAAARSRNSAVPIAARLLEAPAAVFARRFNVESFMLAHRLSSHPLFRLERLAVLADRMIAAGQLKRFVALGGKASTAGSKFTAMAEERRAGESIRMLAETRSWMKLSSTEIADPEYAEVLNQILREIEELAGTPVRQAITWSSLTVFLASPHVVTPYHIDHESNFLLQIAGEKDISLFDPRDRGLLQEEEIERFYVGNFEAAIYRPELQSRGTVYRLVPGKGVHNPPLGPHWVQNGPEVSVSVSIGFCLRPLDRLARAYQVNHLMRRLGLRPTPVGASRFSDELKIAAIGLLAKRNASTPDEILYSGLNRWSAVPRWAKRVLAGSGSRQR